MGKTSVVLDSETIKLRDAAAKTFVYKLGPELKQRYGGRDEYSQGQIETTLRELGIDTRFIAYAFALFRYHSTEEIAAKYRIYQEHLEVLRNEMLELFFSHKRAYSTADVLNHSIPIKWEDGYQGWGY